MCSARVHKIISFFQSIVAWFVARNVVHVREDIYAREQNVYPYLLCGMFCSYLVSLVHTLEGPLHIVYLEYLSRCENAILKCPVLIFPELFDRPDLLVLSDGLCRNICVSCVLFLCMCSGFLRFF